MSSGSAVDVRHAGLADPALSRSSGRSLLVLSVLAGAAVGALVFGPVEHVLGVGALLVAAAVVAMVGAAHAPVRAALLAAFAARATLTLIHSYVVPLPESGADAVMYERMAWSMARMGEGGMMAMPTSGGRLYSWVVGVFYAVAGRSPLMGQSLNVLAGTLVVWNVWAAARMLWNDRAARFAAWVVALFPTAMLYSSIMMREAFVAYPLSLGGYLVIRWRRSGAIAPFVGALLCFAVATAFHSGSFAAILGLLLLLLRDAVVSTGRGSASGLLRLVAATIPLLALLVVLYQTGFGLDKFLRYGALEELSYETIGRAQGRHAEARANYLQGLTVSSPSDLAWQTPIRAVYFLYTPFPWMVSRAGDAAAFFDAALYLWLTVCFLRHRGEVFRKKGASGVTWIWLVCLLVFAIPLSNWGTGMRHRGKLAPLLIMVAAAAWQGVPTRRPVDAPAQLTGLRSPGYTGRP